MSAHKPRVIFAPNARTDYSNLLLHSQRQWGKTQRATYKAQIERVLAELSEFPQLGRARDDISFGLRSHPVGSHLIYYRIEDWGLIVLRIVHHRRDIHDETSLNTP
jgi:toxin ParE1/3/4